MSNQNTSFEPTAVHDQFIEITKRPHPSANQEDVKGNEDPVRQYVVEQAQNIANVKVVFYKPEATAPGDRVIVFRRPGSGNYAGKTPVILQAHMDMVFNPVDMDFPLDVIINHDYDNEGKWLKANDKSGNPSTLGADDGIGVATALAILADENLKDYPLECLFTVQEETDMGGAQNCDLKEIGLTGTKLLNLDAETLNIIIFGSAGGSNTSYQGNISRCDCPDDYTIKKLSISGLNGGHSGVDINKGRLNAIKVLTQVLVRLNKRITNLDAGGDGIGSYDFLIHNMSRTDVIKSNAIPAGSEAVIAIPGDDADKFAADFNAYCEALKTQNMPEEDEFAYNVDPGNRKDQPLDEKSTDALLCILQQIPHGVIKMIPGVPDVVETSTNLYNIAVNGNSVKIGSSNRSSNDMSLMSLNSIQFNIANCFNLTVQTGLDSYPSWPPNQVSALLATAGEVYNKIYDGKYEKTVIHAGLECGVLVKRFKDELGKDLDAISIGPTIKDPHTPSESLQVKNTGGTQTVQQFYDAVSQILQRILAE
jgi:dipeptidase D